MRVPRAVLLAAALAAVPGLAPPTAAATRELNGSRSGTVLKLAPGARAAAMGEAFASVADDATALYYNPAGLIQIERYEATAMHAAWIGGTYWDYLAIAGRPSGNAAVAASVQYLNAGEIQRRDIAGAALGAAAPRDMMLEAGLAVRVSGAENPDLWWDGWTAGIKIKYVSSKIIHTATAFSGGFGLYSPALWNGRARFGWSFDTLGGSLRHDLEQVKLPSASRFGFSYLLAPDFTVALEGALFNDTQTALAFGAERVMRSEGEMSIALRAGLNTRTLQEIDGMSIFRGGVGFIFPNAQFDYAVVPFGDIGLTHRLSMTYRFGSPPRVRRAERRERVFLESQEERQRMRRLEELRDTEIDVDDASEPMIPWID